MHLSVVIPVFNEEEHIASVLARVETALLSLKASSLLEAYEILVIDDGSSDNSPQVLSALKHSKDLKIVLCETNKGKGAALQIGFQMAIGDFVIIQDADHEYEPEDCLHLIREQKNLDADFVLGSRILSKKNKFGFFRQKFANQLLSFLASLMLGRKITDIETCYKLVRRDMLLLCDFNANRFDIEIEIAFELFRFKALKFSEVAISYNPRSYSEGKKIGWKDGVQALVKIFSMGLRNLFLAKRVYNT